MEIKETKPGVLAEETLIHSPGYKLNEIIKAGKAKVIIECVQDIPCNPCETVCPSGAISVGDPITNLPEVDLEKCTGCGICIADCPGQAVFVIDPELDADNAGLMLPFEFLPLPQKGDLVKACDRNGQFVCDAQVININNSKRNNLTPVITISVPKKYIENVRAISISER